MKAWKTVRLGEVIRQRKEFIEIDDLQTYQRARVQLHAKGIVLRDIVEGSLVKTKRQQVSRAGEFLVAEIDAKVGGFGMVPDELDGAIVSSHYFLFQIDEAKLERRFLDYFIRTPSFRDQVEAQGSTNYAAIRPAHVLGYQIPLPPLTEQRRIVARIKALAAEIAEAQRLRHEAVAEAEAMLSSHVGCVFSDLDSSYSRRDFGSFDTHITSGPRDWAKHYEKGGMRFYRAQDIGPAGSILNGGKVFISPPVGNQGRSAMPQPGDLLFVITGATVGRVNVFHEGLEPGFVSQHVAICRLPSDQLDAGFVLWALRTPVGQRQLLGQRYGQGKPGLNLGNIRALSTPVPPLPEQRRIVAELDALQEQVNALKHLQSETAAELDTLLPAILDHAFKGGL
jgi:type I restriction enzyme S subunit